MTSQTFVNVDTRKFWTIRFNPNARHLVTHGGKLGTKGLRQRFGYDSCEATREAVEDRITKHLDEGFVQVA